MQDDLFLIDDTQQFNKHSASAKRWKILIVDDDQSVLIVTSAAIKNKTFDDKGLEILTASSAKTAKMLLRQHNDIALAIIDVVMETPEAGLHLINFIRNDLQNKLMRLVLRTGQPNQAPEEYIIDQYDINDYKEKTELTSQKLYTLVRTSLKQYAQILALKESRDDMYVKMTTNELTQLPNRMKLNELLDIEGKQSLVLININDFCMINDSLGYSTGNHLLKSVAKYLNKMSDENHIVFHLQSDIYAILCSHLDLNETQFLLLNLQSDVAEQSFDIGDSTTQITVSIGIALLESGNLIQKAELALKEARKYGRNHGQVYSENLKIIHTTHANILWSKRLRNAIKDNKIHAYFQPIKEIKSQKIVKYEALARLEYDNVIYSPEHFLEAALYSGQIYEIFKLMFVKACVKVKESGLSVSVNVSEYDLKESDFFNFIKHSLISHNVKSHQLTLEILEYKSISNDSEIQMLINAIHDLGVKISIDDFGANCSNFSQLNNLPIDYIKIDGGFIDDIVSNVNSQIVAQTIIDYSHRKNIPVIAEFVSSEEVYNYVRNLGADFAQGYYIGEPAI